MEEEPGLSSQYRRASPWPLIVVLGFVFSELGIVFGVPPVSVGGLLLLSGSVVGILRESGYAQTLWGPGVVMGLLFTSLGALLYVATAATSRAFQVGAGGLIVLVVAVVRYLTETGRL